MFNFFRVLFFISAGEGARKRKMFWAQFEVIYLLFSQQFNDRMSNAFTLFSSTHVHGVYMRSNPSDQRFTERLYAAAKRNLFQLDRCSAAR